MPELPEVETIRMQLEQKIKGLKITEVEVLMKKSFIGEVGEIRGRRVIGVRRRGKITIIELEGGVYLAIHLKLTGQLIFRENQELRIKNKERYCEQKDGPFKVCELPNKFTRVIISFDSGGKPCLPAGRLYFNDMRIFGWMRVLRVHPEGSPRGDMGDLGIEKMGPEANDEKSFTLEYFCGILSKSGKPVKILIMDQEKLAGVGNIYANEALFRARILPMRKANTLTEKETETLRESILNILKEAIGHKGCSDRDEAYRQISGEKGEEQNYLQVYGKAGQKCSVCGGVIKRIALGGRGTFFCSTCQR